MEKKPDLKYLLEIARDLASTLDINSLLQKIVKVAASITQSEAASILLYDQKKDELRFKAASNQDSVPQLIDMIVPKESIAGWVAQTQQTIFVPDVHSDHRFYDQVEKNLEFVTQSIIAIPLITKSKLIGVLEVINKKETSFTDNELELLETLGAQASVAIENSRLFEQSDAIKDLVHELRTPLASIKTIAYLLKKPEISQENKEKLLNTIQNETNRLNDLVSNFLDFVKLESGRLAFEFSSFDFGTLVNECLFVFYPLAQQKNITVDHHQSKHPMTIQADRKKIKQVLINLISNSIKYNKENGSVSIQYTITDEYLIFTITDNGIGISEREIPRVFEKFFRASSVDADIQGTGLGLSISKQIVDHHHGNISVQSQEGTGSTFRFKIPVTQN